MPEGSRVNIVGETVEAGLAALGISVSGTNLLLGSPTDQIISVVIGRGDTSTTVNSVVIVQPTSRTGAGNLAGSVMTIRGGVGTGSGFGAYVALATVRLDGPAGVAQGLEDRVFVYPGGGVQFGPPDDVGSILNAPVSLFGKGNPADPLLNFELAVNGAGVEIGTLTNAPSAGNPTFWLPVQFGGTTVRYVPCW